MSSRPASSVLAASMRPEVSRSSRCTMPSRSASSPCVAPGSLTPPCQIARHPACRGHSRRRGGRAGPISFERACPRLRADIQIDRLAVRPPRTQTRRPTRRRWCPPPPRHAFWKPWRRSQRRGLPRWRARRPSEKRRAPRLRGIRRLPASSVATIWQSERDMASILSTSCQRVIPRTGYFSSWRGPRRAHRLMVLRASREENSTNPQACPRCRQR